MDKLLTVIVQTSPLPSHPSTALLEALFRSFDRVECLKECKIVILCDGCQEKLLLGPIKNIDDGENEKEKRTSKRKTNYKHGAVSQDTSNNYRVHLQVLHEKIVKQEPPFIPSANGSIQLLKLPYRHGSAKAIAAAFDILSISTPYVLLAQHDNFWIRDVRYLQQMIEYMETEETKPWLQCVHFPSTATLNYVQKVKRRYSLDLERFCKQPQNISPCGSFIPLVFWYGRTHIARTSYYTGKILSETPLKVGDHLEEIWGTKQLNEIMELNKTSVGGEEFKSVHAKYGNYVFFDNEGNEEQQEVLYHLSGRKAHAAHGSSDNAVYSAIDGETKSGNATFNPQDKSFTTARMAMAVVPGLEFAPITDTGSMAIMKVGQTKPFRQKCFHCGEKGHSFKFCPDITKDMPNMEILDLS